MTDQHTNALSASASLKEKLATQKGNPSRALKSLAERYATERRSKEKLGYRNFLLTGRHGSGKTTLSATGKRPIIAHSFDAGDLESIQDEIDEGWIIPNDRWEDEVHTGAPWAWKSWLEEMQKLKESDIFSQIGTYVLHSLTGLNTAAMNYVIGTSRLTSGDTPKWEKDYLPTQTLIIRAIRECCSLPCDFILSAHADKEQDAMSGRMFGTVAATGKVRILLPPLFSEIYFMESRPNPQNFKKREFVIHTQPEGIWDARTRMGRKGRLDPIEPFNLDESPCGIEKLYRKAGYDFQHQN